MLCRALYNSEDAHGVNHALLERLIANGSFNPEHMAESDYSHSTAILLAFIPDAKLKDIERVGIGLVVHWLCSGPLALISSVQQFISYICDVLKLGESISQADIRNVCHAPWQLWWAYGFCH